MASVRKGDRVLVKANTTPVTVYAVNKADEYVDVLVAGTVVRVPEDWCQPVKRVPLTIVLANLIEDGENRFMQTAVDVIDVTARRLSDAGYALAANWLREAGDQK